MAMVTTDALDPGQPHVMDGIAPGHGPGAPHAGTSVLKTLKQKILTLTFSGTYATGGYTLALVDMAGLSCLFARAVGGGYIVHPTYNVDGTVTLKLYWKIDDAVSAEITNGTALATVMRLLVIGREA